MTISKIDTNIDINNLKIWGKVTQLGGTILDDSGSDVDVFWSIQMGEPSSQVSSGYFGTRKGKYRLVYPFSEQAVIVHGRVKILDESTSIETIYEKGDMWIVEKGTSTVWEVLSDEYLKHYFYVI